MERLRDSVVLVEGKKDERALEPYMESGKILKAAGRLETACRRASEIFSNCRGKAGGEAIVLMDRDSAGEELAVITKGELEANSIKADLETRKRLMAILRLTHIENFGKKYTEKLEELKEN
ncbi:hypothetical protein GF415_04440 [Candidatus Micrarchaeota archaeon]|nr:hypothetical protein [Candidatus Micrarchaeota archaeon]